MNRLVAISEKGARMGEGHGRAKFSDHDIDLMVALLEARGVLVAYCQAGGMPQGELERTLAREGLSYRHIAEKFECSKAYVRWLNIGLRRSQVPARWKRLPNEGALTPE